MDDINNINKIVTLVPEVNGSFYFGRCLSSFLTYWNKVYKIIDFLEWEKFEEVKLVNKW